MPVYIHIKRLYIKSLFFLSVTSFIFISHFLDLHKEQGKIEKTRYIYEKIVYEYLIL